MKSQLMKYSVMFVLLLVALSYSQLSFAQLQNSVGLSYDECQKQIHDQMNKTVSSIDKSKAISLAQSSPEFLAKVTKLKHTFSSISTNMTWNDFTCGDVKLKNVTVQFSLLNDKGIFEKYIQVDTDPNLDKIIRVRDVFVETCDNNCPPPGPPPFDVQEDADSDIIRAQCLDGTQFLRQGKVDVIQLGDEGKFYVNKDAKIVSSILHKDAKPQTAHLRLEITNPQQDINLNQTKQIIFDDCPSRAIVEWHFTPKVPGKHQVKFKELESGSGYSTNIEVKDLDKIEFIDGKPFFVSEKYNATRDSDKIIMFHGVTFTHPAFPDPPIPGGGAFTNIIFPDGAKETLSNVGLLKNPILFTKHVNPQAAMKENPYDIFSLLVSADLAKISPLQQFRSGIPVNQIQCKEGLVLLLHPIIETPACVKTTTQQKLVQRGWYYLVPFGDSQAGSQSNSAQTYLCKKDFESFFECVVDADSSTANQTLEEFDGVIVDQSLDNKHAYAFLTNDQSRTFNTGSTGIRLEGINDIDSLHGQHVKIFGTVITKLEDEDKIQVHKMQKLDSLIPSGSSVGKSTLNATINDLKNNPDQYYNQVIRITGNLREHDYMLAYAGVGCYTANYTTSDQFAPDFISRRQLYDKEHFIEVRIGGHDDVGYSESEKLPTALKFKQVTITGTFIPNVRVLGECNHVLHKSGYILTDFDKIKPIE